MITEVEHLPELKLATEVAVVGGGFAGLDLARHLGQQGVRVVVLESGRMDFDPAHQELARLVSAGKPLRQPSADSPFNPYLPKRYRGWTRVRQLGGTSNIWTGKWRAFDDLDFSERTWVPHSGWPLTRAELLPYYRRVAETYAVADVEGFEADDRVRRARAELAREGLKLSVHYWASAAARPREVFLSELEHSEHVQIVLGATATELELDEPDQQRVVAVHARSLSDREVTVTADQVVLAAGGVQDARLLLASDRQRPGGIGNEHDLVGRFHQDHPKTKSGRLQPGPAFDLIEPWTRTEPRPTFHVSLSLDDDVQRDEEVLDHALYLSPVFSYLEDYPRRAVDRLKTAVRERRLGAALAAAAALLRSPSALRKIAQRTRHRDVDGPISSYRASCYVEQAPNAHSRIVLSPERDAVGMRRAVVDWQLAELDRRSFPRTWAALRERLERAGIGTLDFGPDGPDLDEWTDAAHHIGATRMAVSPAEGVVDPSCRVFGTTNLYIASASVFPTGHSAAPTMTILALARRLCDHLVAQQRSGARAGRS